ncbi:hypothetical protein A1704_20995 [Chryseobacterium cucumeris]|uniref:hypothetical protein n=1 Tax=Chryseobacterium cucumeris TaxID=1813611 RepID=UPI0007871F95|nr:hypothetical protein [Chryseobacterium cucumeris]KYH03861.1 hypothetical protein A1704_20995 [Chryseobacterium cucumeris]
MTIIQLHILDWYDDIITSWVSLENDSYIFTCVQKDFTDGEKTYYGVKTDEKSSKEMQNIIGKKTFTKRDWSTINRIFEGNNKSDNVFLLRTLSLSVGLDITFSKVRNSDIRTIMLPVDISTLYTCQDRDL